jgi:hypothetical protein
MNISLSFLNYNSYDYIVKQLSLDYFTMSNNIINEIIIQDDCTDDYNNLKLLEKENIKVFQNTKRLKPLLSRIEILKNCNNDWVLLMDSDNFLDKNSFDNLFKVLTELKDNTIYSPDFARPAFNYKKYSNTVIDFDFAKKEINQDTFQAFLNTGNYLVPKQNYLKIAEKIEQEYHEHMIEVMYYNFLWLKNGNYIKCVENYEYDHTMRGDSFSRRCEHDWRPIFKSIKDKFE